MLLPELTSSLSVTSKDETPLGRVFKDDDIKGLLFFFFLSFFPLKETRIKNSNV